ncbi:hypothetical protein MsAg5_05930 [Methanosarcinaceae archaeon Ag5]|uniref:Uncharacterized protein n=1 Tax=Methanolapillus africanus TaxID=3028297 RepID=A0AAE4SCS0_9EURY|nr:hypothetical protein [Methanosarcinaceae archaeon Ag5]
MFHISKISNVFGFESVFQKIRVWRTPRINLVLAELEQNSFYEIQEADEIQERFRKIPEVCDVLLYTLSQLEEKFGPRLKKIEITYNYEDECIEIIPFSNNCETSFQFELYDLDFQIRQKFGSLYLYISLLGIYVW